MAKHRRVFDFSPFSSALAAKFKQQKKIVDMCETVADIPNQARFGKMISRQLQKKKKSHTRSKNPHTPLHSVLSCVNNTANEMHRNESAVARKKEWVQVQHLGDLKQGGYCRCVLSH